MSEYPEYTESYHPIQSADKSDPGQSYHWRFQFTLRSLMLFVLFVAFFLTNILMYQRMSRAEQELVKLRKIAGNYKIEDENLLYAIAIETNEPLSWRWRVYLPAGHKFTWHYYAGDIPADNTIPKSGGSFGSGASRSKPEEAVVYLNLRKNLDNQWALNLLQESKNSKISTSHLVTDDIVEQIRKAQGSDWECIGNGKDESRKLDGLIVFLKYRIGEKYPNGSWGGPAHNPTPGIMLWLEAVP
jgi:hypothetical protein